MKKEGGVRKENISVCEGCIHRKTAGVIYTPAVYSVAMNYSAEIAPTGQAASHAPHERHASLSIS